MRVESSVHRSNLQRFGFNRTSDFVRTRSKRWTSYFQSDFDANCETSAVAQSLSKARPALMGLRIDGLFAGGSSFSTLNYFVPVGKMTYAIPPGGSRALYRNNATNPIWAITSRSKIWEVSDRSKTHRFWHSPLLPAVGPHSLGMITRVRLV